MIQIDVDKGECLVGMEGDISSLTSELLYGVSEVLYGISTKSGLPLDVVQTVFTSGLPLAIKLAKDNHESKSSD